MQQIHRAGHCGNLSCAGSMGKMPIKKGEVSLFWAEYEFATAIKYLLCHPKEHYNSYPPPSCTKKKTFHLAVQFWLITVCFTGHDSKGKKQICFLNSSKHLFFMERIAVKPVMFNHYLASSEERAACI